MTTVILSTAFLDFAEKHESALFPIPFGYKEDPGWKKENRISDPSLRPIVWQFSREWSRDRAQWQRWHDEHKCNFGLVAGPSGCVALDLDVAKDKDIWAKYCVFWTSRGLAAPMPQFKSARDGWHVLIKVPAGFDISTLQQIPLMDNVDTRVGNGYIVAPGSYYDGTPDGRQSGHYQMVANAPAPNDDPAVFQVLVDVLGIKGKPGVKGIKGIKGKPGAQVDLSLLPPIDEVVSRIQNAYDAGPLSYDGQRWVRNPDAHADNADPADRARREANGYFANYAQWSPVVGAVRALYGESAKARVAPLMDRGREHKQMFESAWNGKAPAADIAYASLLKFIGASNDLGFNDGGRYRYAKRDQMVAGFAAAVGVEYVKSPDLPPGAPVSPMTGNTAGFIAELAAPTITQFLELTTDTPAPSSAYPQIPVTVHDIIRAISARKLIRQSASLPR